MVLTPRVMPQAGGSSATFGLGYFHGGTLLIRARKEEFLRLGRTDQTPWLSSTLVVIWGVTLGGQDLVTTHSPAGCWGALRTQKRSQCGRHTFSEDKVGKRCSLPTALGKVLGSWERPFLVQIVLLPCLLGNYVTTHQASQLLPHFPLLTADTTP